MSKEQKSFLHCLTVHFYEVYNDRVCLFSNINVHIECTVTLNKGLQKCPSVRFMYFVHVHSRAISRYHRSYRSLAFNA